MAEVEEVIEESKSGEPESREEDVEIDINATLLEIMVERAMILDDLLAGHIEASEAHKRLEKVGATIVEILSPRRRRKR